MDNHDQAIKLKNEAVEIIKTGGDLTRVGQIVLEIGQIIDSGRSVPVAVACRLRIYRALAGED